MAESLTVVLVDDSRIALAQLERVARDIEGVDVVATAQDGACAVRTVSHFKPDLVLMDIVMPGMDGLAALRVIRATQPDVRVVMISSLAGSASSAEEAFRLGASQVIAKPVDPAQLAELLETTAAELRRDDS